MDFDQQAIEQIGAWCFNCPELTAERKRAWRQFFGEEDPRPVRYWTNADERVSRERRFLGWFLFDYVLPNGEKPAQVAARRLYSGSAQSEALEAMSGARYLFAVVSSVYRRSVYLEVEDETFEVRSPVWAANVRRNQALVAHIVPVRHGYWLPGPGWLIWPTTLGPGMRENLREMQTDPVSMERSLQGRFDTEDKPEPPRPQDSTLEAAVVRLDSWAREKNHPQLVMTVDRWRELVQRYIGRLDAVGFMKEVVGKAGKLASEAELQEMLMLANNVWNNTPQPDRGGLSPRQLVELQQRSSQVTKRRPPAKKTTSRPRARWHFDPDRGGVPVPESVQRRTERRIRRFAEEHFAGRYTRLVVRFRGQFCYIDAYREPAEPSPSWPPPDWPETREEMQERLRNTPVHLCRLRYFGNQEGWGFAFYTYSNERYELSVFSSGEFFGPPEEAFRIAAAVYLR